MKGKRKDFFFEKKKQKTFANCGQQGAARNRQKFFGSFFQKRTAFFYFLCLALAGCGKIGDPSPPGPPDQIIYPRIYPTK